MRRIRTVMLGCAAVVLAAPVVQAQPTTEEKIEILTQEVEQLRQEVRGGGGAGAGATHIGGYGELHYNNFDEQDAEIDFHRFVLEFGHEFTDRIRFFSEVEIEHALVGEGAEGEVELEQAFIDFDLTDNHTARGGLFLIPVGILNETHEPPTFYGVERNPIEDNIIPATWWEGGGAIYGRLAPGLSYDFAVTSGLNVPVTGGDAFTIRDGRQKVSEATAEDLAYTGRLRWSGAPGIEVAGTLQYQQNVTQGALDDASAVLSEVHAIYARGPFGLRALYARWDIDGTAFEAAGADEQTGWYIEPSFKITPQVGVFARYNEWDTRAGADGADTVNEQTNIGVNYWPHPQVVLKADFENQENASGDIDGFNLGIGYLF